MRSLLVIVGLFASFAVRADTSPEGLRDLYFGEAIFFAEQQRYFDALERLDTELAQHYGIDEPELDTLTWHVNDAEFDVGDFELNYRMHHRAGRAITAVLEGDVEPEVRNEAAFRLARIHFQKGQFDDALVALQRIDGRMPEGLEPEVEFLRANVLLAIGRADDAADTLNAIRDTDALAGFADYNLGIALLESEQRNKALQQLDRAGQVRAGDDATRAIRDKANLVLGSLLMDAQEYDRAQVSFDRVRLDGPMSNQALLSAGWASVSANDFERALVPWGLLAARNSTDASVQEAKLALPFAYGELEVYGRAATLYREALDSFETEVRKLQASIDSIRKGDFLKVLVREEIRRDADWVIRLRELPESPETWYMMELMASHDFQTALQNYLDLEDLRVRLASWQHAFDAYEDLIGLRRENYEPILPEVDQEFRELDSKIRLRREQHALLQRRRDDQLTAPRPDFLATGEEREMNSALLRMRDELALDPRPEARVLEARIDRLRGTLHWTLTTEYYDRLIAFDQHLRELSAEIETMTAQYDQYVRVRQAAEHGYEGFAPPIRRLRTRVRTAESRVNLLMARQGHILELVAVDELLARRERLNEYRDQARYALADSYDRATKARELDLGERTAAAAEDAR